MVLGTHLPTLEAPDDTKIVSPWKKRPMSEAGHEGIRTLTLTCFASARPSKPANAQNPTAPKTVKYRVQGIPGPGFWTTCSSIESMSNVNDGQSSGLYWTRPVANRLC